jgi:hypothetical protein
MRIILFYPCGSIIVFSLREAAEMGTLLSCEQFWDCFIYFIFLSVTGFECGASHLLGRSSTT